MNEERDPKQAAAETRAKIHRYFAEISRRDHFQIFGADPDTDLERIRTAYHGLARRWHADAFAQVDLGDAKDALDAIFKQITEAYETIADPKKRAEYLTFLERRSKGLSTDVSAVLQGEQLLDEALAQIKRRDWDGAFTTLNRAIEHNPDDPLFKVNLGWVIYNRNRTSARYADEAIDLLKTAIKTQANLAPAYQYLGQIYFATERADEAKKAWKKCLEWEPANIDASRGLRLLSSREKKANSGIGALIGKLFRR